MVAGDEIILLAHTCTPNFYDAFCCDICVALFFDVVDLNVIFLTFIRFCSLVLCSVCHLFCLAITNERCCFYSIGVNRAHKLLLSTKQSAKLYRKIRIELYYLLKCNWPERRIWFVNSS